MKFMNHFGTAFARHECPFLKIGGAPSLHSSDCKNCHTTRNNQHTMTGTVYYNILSPVARLAYMVGLATGTAEGRHLAMETAEHKSETYLKINPFGEVPAYTDEVVTLYESSAIVRYLIRKGHSELLPFDDPVKFAKIDMVYEKINTTIIPAINLAADDIFFGRLFSNPVPKEKCEERINVIEAKFKLIEAHFFKSSNYLSGTEFTVADLLLCCGLIHLSLIEYDFSKFEKIAKFYETVSKLEYVQKVEKELRTLLDIINKDLEEHGI